MSTWDQLDPAWHGFGLGRKFALWGYAFRVSAVHSDGTVTVTNDTGPGRVLNAKERKRIASRRGFQWKDGA